MPTPTQTQTAAQIVAMLLTRDDPALHGLAMTASGITLEQRWPNAVAVRLYAVATNGGYRDAPAEAEVTIDVEIDPDGTTTWRYATGQIYLAPMPTPHAAEAIR